MVKCKCKVDPRIKRGYNKTVNDDSPNKPTKLYRVLVMECPVCKKSWEIEQELEIGDREGQANG